jgi:predicted site-specific integrase-resolvase
MSAYNVSEFAKLVGVSVKTLQRWDREGRLVPYRTPTNRRVYTDEHLAEIFGARKRRDRKTVVYARVSSRSQRSDLDNQVQALGRFCAARGYIVDETIKEIGGGLNFKRPKFLQLLDRIIAGEIERLIIAHKDRLARFGFPLIRHLCETHDCELIVINDESLSPERELVEDVLAIIHCFSARLYGLRNYRKILRKALFS